LVTPINYGPCVLGHPASDARTVTDIVGDIRDSVTVSHSSAPVATLGDYIASKSPEGVDKASLDVAEIKRPVARKPAPEFLDDAARVMKARAQLRDQPSGERSMERTVSIFNAWTGNNLSVQDGWRFLVALKQAREIQGFYNEDDYTDMSAYCSLLGEEESMNQKRQKP
jgi:hypothetical protein